MNVKRPRQSKDPFSKAKRSEVMSHIRSKGTRLDTSMQLLLTEMGVWYRPYPRIVGNPDFLVQEKIALFCDSGFWHGRNWKALKKRLEMGSRPEYWVSHIGKNRTRDRWVTRRLRSEGYLVLRFWDDEIYRNPQHCKLALNKALESIAP